ncbi:MAG: LuxR C-terminal-related transcriptional regulator, partial [Aeromicrobium sp.]
EGAPASSAATAADALVRQEGARLIAGLESSGRLDLLLRTSIAERITPPVIAALVDDVDGAGVFDWMEVEGLGARDEAGRFRHHPFVREVLEAELVRRHPADVPELRRRLARWADTNEDIPTAIRQAALVRDWDLLSAVTRRHFGPITRLYSAEMRDALDEIPIGTLRRSPILLTTLALLLNAQPTTTSQRLRALATIASSLLRDRLAKDESSERMWLLICRMAVERLTGRHDQAARTADDILEYLPLWEHRPDDDLRGTLSIVQLQVATSLFYVGRHADATPLLRDVGATGAPWRAMHALALDVLITAMRGDMAATLSALGPLRERQSPSGWRGTYSATGYHLAEALLHLEDFDIDGARREVAMLDAHRPTIEHWPLLLRLDGLIALTDGDAFGGAQRLTAALAERKIASTSTAMSALVAATRADLLLAAGQTQRARQILPQARLESRLPLARIALADNRPDRALELVDPVVWEGGHLPRSQAEALLVQAVALARTGGPAAGVEAAATALGVMREAALRRPLMMVPRSDLLPILQLVDGVDAEELLAGVPDPFGSASVLPRLSARERDVLAELVTTPGAAEIAARLFVSTNTVKSQLRSIYRKLGVTSREEALRVAFERGLARGSD